MGLITKEVTIVTNSSNYKHYVDLGYATKYHEKMSKEEIDKLIS